MPHASHYHLQFKMPQIMSKKYVTEFNFLWLH